MEKRTAWKDSPTTSFSSSYLMKSPAEYEIGSHEDPNGKYMEDRVITKFDDGVLFLAVYDGHGGCRTRPKHQQTRCVDYVSEHLDATIIPLIKKSSMAGFQQLRDDISEAYRMLDLKCLHDGYGIENGTTACAAVIIGRKIYITNLGDSRAILCTKDGKLETLTSLHRPGEKTEKTRIEREGNNVVEHRDGTHVEHRLGCGLSVSRSFGDFNIQQPENCSDHSRITRSNSLPQSAMGFQLFLPSHSPYRVLKPSDSLSTLPSSLDDAPAEDLSSSDSSPGRDGSSSTTEGQATSTHAHAPNRRIKNNFQFSFPKEERALLKERYFGRKCSKPIGLSYKPEVRRHTITENDEFLIVACDGVFDSLIDLKLPIQIVRNVLQDKNKTASDAVKELIRRCKANKHISGVLDNLSAVIVVFRRVGGAEFADVGTSGEGNESAPAQTTYPNSALHRLRMRKIEEERRKQEEAEEAAKAAVGAGGVEGEGEGLETRSEGQEQTRSEGRNPDGGKENEEREGTSTAEGEEII